MKIISYMALGLLAIILLWALKRIILRKSKLTDLK